MSKNLETWDKLNAFIPLSLWKLRQKTTSRYWKKQLGRIGVQNQECFLCMSDSKCCRPNLWIQMLNVWKFTIRGLMCFVNSCFRFLSEISAAILSRQNLVAVQSAFFSFRAWNDATKASRSCSLLDSRYRKAQWENVRCCSNLTKF